MKKCCHCRRERSDNEMVQTVLTEAERAYVKQHGGPDTADFWECKPCRNVLANREQGAQLIKGTLQINLTAGGNPNAERIAQKMYDKLIEKSAKGPVS